MKKVIKLKESDIVKMVKLVLEQGEPGFLSIQEALHYIEDKINVEILPRMQVEVLNRYTIKVNREIVPDKENPDRNIAQYSVTIKGEGGQKNFPLEKINEYTYQGSIKESFIVGEVRTESIIDELKTDPKVKLFLDKNPTFEDEILNGLVNAILRADRQGTGKFILSFGGIKRGKLEGGVPAGQEYPLGDFFEKNSLPMVVNKDTGAFLQSGGISMSLSKFYFSGPGVSTYTKTSGGTKPSTGTTTTDTVIKLNFTLVDAFKFDETNFVDEAKALEQIDAFVSKVKGGVQKYGQELSQHIMKAEPSIVGYASVDADPNEKITGKFTQCKSEPNRGEYNKCLSEYRANRIAEIINQKLEGTGVSLNFFGAGETTQFGPGWTKEKPTTTQETAPNRRFTLTPIPPFSKVIKGQ